MWTQCGMLTVVAIAVTSVGASQNRRGVLCGSDLSEALALVCDNIYYSPRQKKSPVSAGVLRSEDALSFLERRRRQSTGVVEECCHKSCTIQELLAYCGN